MVLHNKEKYNNTIDRQSLNKILLCYQNRLRIKLRYIYKIKISLTIIIIIDKFYFN